MAVEGEEHRQPAGMKDGAVAGRTAFCGQCGARLEAGDRFCGACGAVVPERAEDASPTEQAQPAEARPPEESEAAPDAPRSGKRRSPWRLLFLPLLAMGIAGGYLGLRLAVDEFSPGFVYALAFSADGSRLASAGPDSRLRLWDTASGKQIGAADLPVGCRSIAFSPDGTRLAAACPARIWLLRVPGLTAAGVLSGHADSVHGLCFDPDGKTLYSVDSRFGLGVWDVVRRARLGGLPPDAQAFVQSASFSADCSLLAYASGPPSYEYQVVRRINLDPVMQIKPAFAERPEQFALGLKGSLLFGVSYGRVRLWRVNSGRVARSLAFDRIYPSALAISPDNRFFAIGSGGGEIRLYEAGKGGHLRTIRHAGTVARWLQQTFPR